jgi:hypothetical protein
MNNISDHARRLLNSRLLLAASAASTVLKRIVVNASMGIQRRKEFLIHAGVYTALHSEPEGVVLFAAYMSQIAPHSWISRRALPVYIRIHHKLMYSTGCRCSMIQPRKLSLISISFLSTENGTLEN